MFKFCADEVAAGGFDAVDGLDVIEIAGTREFTCYGN